MADTFGILRITLFFLLMLPPFTLQQTIGSCRDGGFNTCCTTGGCRGFLSNCRCDIFCHEFRDCCSDIEETCPETFFCNQVGIRLAESSMRLEICSFNVWGSLCTGDTWDDVEATIACRDLGYVSGRAFVTNFGSVPVHALTTECIGNETSFLDCVDLPDYDYVLYEDGGVQVECTMHAGLICEGCTDGDIRLRDGYVGGDDRDGRVEVCLNNTWGSLCSDSWDVEDASVACTQLGYSSENGLPANFWPALGLVHAQEVQVHCSGTETSLGDCIAVSDGNGPFLPIGEVTCSSHAGVICEAPCRTAGFTSCCLDTSCFVSSAQCLCNSIMCPSLGNCCPDILFLESCPVPPVCNETDVRLVRGMEAGGSSGRVEICLLGQWGTVCDDFWDNEDAAVVCRQLGLESQGAIAVLDAAFGPGDGRILLDQVLCSGNESRLFDCRHRGVGVHSLSCISASDAGVVCPVAGVTTCMEGAVRLQDGATNSSGRVEVCFAGVWGTVCPDFWDDRDAAVVCRQLGYNSTDAEAITSSTSPSGTGLIFLSNVDCTGSEDSLVFDCNYRSIGTFACSRAQDAGVVCVPEFSMIGFEEPVYIFSEETSTNEVCITTNGSILTDSVEVIIRSQDISATGNSDYSPVAEQLIFAPENSLQCVSILITGNDEQCESEESFLLSIDITSGSTRAGLFRQTTTVIITDSVPAYTFFNFGPSTGDLPLELQPNGKAPPLQLAQSFHFFGSNYSTLHVNPNGILSFETPISEGPAPFPVAQAAAIAPFWEEVEYSERDRIYYQESSQWCLLVKTHVLMQISFPSAWNFFPAYIFTATWMVFEPVVQNQVHNTFQAVLASDGELSFVVLYYDTIEWGFRDGTAGLNAGDGMRYEAPNTPSGNPAIDSNVRVPGLYVYRVDQNDILEAFECADGDIRESELGLLEICVNKTWARICAEFLSDREAAAACQQLGYSVGEDAAVVFSAQNESSITLMNEIDCNGGQSELIDCLLPPIPLFTMESCVYAGVSCTDIVVGLVQEEYTVSEDGSLRVCATLNQVTSRRVVVRLATVESASPNSDTNRAQDGMDYNTTATQFMFEAGVANQLLCADIPIIDDDIYERNEVMLVFLSTPDQGVQLDPQYAFITISDNDVVTVQLITGNHFVGEETSSLSICIQKEGETEVDFNVTLSTMSFTDTTAEANVDFIAVSETVTFSPNDTLVCRIVMVVDDSIAFEGNEQFTVEVISVVPDVLIGTVSTSDVTIIDNDQVLSQFSNSSYEVNENNGTVIVCAMKDLETASSFNVTATIRDTEVLLPNPAGDFVTTTAVFVFPPGTVNTICEQFQILADSVALEGSEEFIVDLSIPFLMSIEGMEGFGFDSIVTAANCTLDGDVVIDSATITIIDTDVVTVQFSNELYETNEDDGTVSVCLRKDIDTAKDLLINIIASELEEEQAIGGEDFVSISLNITFPGDQSMSCVEITIIDDSIVSEGDEQFMVRLTVLTPDVETGIPNTSYVTITDNDITIEEPLSDNSASIGGAVAGAVIGVCLILLLVVIFFIARHMKQKRHVPDQIESEERAGQNPYVNLSLRRRMTVSSSQLQELPQEMRIPRSIIRLLDSIGEGEFGLVYRGEILHPVITETVAVKTLKGFFDQNQINDMLKESLKMWKFKHPNVMTLIGVCIDGGPTPYIVMPFMENGSLLSYLKKERSKLVLPARSDSDSVLSTSKKLMDMCIQVAKGMEYLASQNFVHKDLAARNCMIDLYFVIKIADFGLSENIYDRNYIRKGKDEGGKLPIKWMALESLTDLVFSEKTDVWAFGVTCWEVFSGGKIPYPAVDPVALPSMLQSGYRAEKPDNAACSDVMYSIMLECWKENPDERPTFSQLVSSISSQLEGLAGYLDVSTFGDWQTSASKNAAGTDRSSSTVFVNPHADS